MMRFKRFSRQRAATAQPVGRAAALLFAGLAGGCSAPVSGFEFPELQPQRRPQAAADRFCRARGNPSYLSNEVRSGGGYNAPRTYRESSVSSQSLPDASPPPSNYAANDRRYDQGGASNGYAANGRYDNTANNSYANRRYDTAATTTASTNRYDPQPQPSLANPGDMIEVQPGDTLYGLSRRHRVGVAELMQVNSLTNPNLHPGQKLYLPQGYAANRSQPAPVQTASVQQPAPVSVPADLDAKYRGSYTMRPGDSLYGISRSYGVPVAELQQANGITDARGLKAGAVLRVPDTAGGAPGQPLQQIAVNPPPVAAAVATNSRATFPRRPSRPSSTARAPAGTAAASTRRLRRATRRPRRRAPSPRRRSRSSRSRAATTSCAGRRAVASSPASASGATARTTTASICRCRSEPRCTRPKAAPSPTPARS